jgi:hypothetical protein
VDLEASRDQDGKAHRLMRAIVMLCFMAAAAALIATLARNSSTQRTDIPLIGSMQ